MKNRWIGALALATALMLGACAPPNQGAGESEEPANAAESSAPASVEASESAEPMESEEAAEASESAAPTPDDYEY
jgi:starvation-inducible outer membrane lipoprotein